MDVDLCHGIAGDRTGVGHIHFYIGRVADMHAGLAQLQVGESESGIAEPITKGKQGFRVDVPVS
jgi:hypothetical protein